MCQFMRILNKFLILLFRNLTNPQINLESEWFFAYVDVIQSMRHLNPSAAVAKTRHFLVGLKFYTNDHTVPCFPWAEADLWV